MMKDTISSESTSSDAVEKPESLQRALRSPLQGALLSLDLIREDAQLGKISLEDVDSVIESLKCVVQLLDNQTDTEGR